MAARRQICRYENKATEVADKLFFNESAGQGTKASMRQAAKKFANSADFTDDCAYYEGRIVEGRWQFTACGKRMS